MNISELLNLGLPLVQPCYVPLRNENMKNYHVSGVASKREVADDIGAETFNTKKAKQDCDAASNAPNTGDLKQDSAAQGTEHEAEYTPQDATLKSHHIEPTTGTLASSPGNITFLLGQCSSLLK